MNRIEILREKVTKLVVLLTDKRVKVTQRGQTSHPNCSYEGLEVPFVLRMSVINEPLMPNLELVQEKAA